MLNYRTPGVYVEEISAQPASIAEVETAIPAFVGYTKKRKRGRERIPKNVPVLIESFREYENTFGAQFCESLRVTLTSDATSQDNTRIEIMPGENDLPVYLMHQSMEFYFGNGGGRCYVVSVGDGFDGKPGIKTIKYSELEAGLKALEKVNDVTLLVIPEAVNLIEKDRKSLYDAMLAQCGRLEDRFAILDVWEPGDNSTIEDAANFRNHTTGNSNLKFGAAYYPTLHTTIRRNYNEKMVEISDERDIQERKKIKVITLTDLKKDQNNSVLSNRISQKLKNMNFRLYPSAAIAGIYVCVDRERGVWKAPANVSLNLVSTPSKIIHNHEQSDLNHDSTSGKSINAIRNFIGRGTLVWGARTLAGNDNEWRYVPVRRLANFIRSSVSRTFGPVIYESNNAATWKKIKAGSENFLNSLWRDGAFTGTRPHEAYFVRVGLGQTMNENDINNGKIIVELGLAPVRPSEFIILTFRFKVEEL